MKFARVFGVLGLGLLAACTSEYIPAEKIQFDTYGSLIKDLGKEMSYAKLAELNRYVDSEMQSALHEVFANAEDENTEVYYGSNGHTQDGKDAMRVIWHRYVPAKNINITVMTFWLMSGGKPELDFGSDGIRVRTFVGSGDEWKQSSKYIWMSYWIAGKGNRVNNFMPTLFIGEKGERDESVASEADPTQCASCHYHTLQGRVSDSKLDRDDSLRDFLELGEKAELPAEFKNPKETFFIEG